MLVFAWGLSAQAAPATQAAPAPSDSLGQAYFLFLQGRSLEEAGKVDDAIATYRQALTLEPKAAEIHAELAGLYARQNKANESISEAQAALAIDPSDREAHRILGLVQAALADQASTQSGAALLRTQAIAHLERVVSPNMRDPLSELTLGRLYVETEDYAKGITTLQLFLLSQPGYPEAVMLLAQAYDDSSRPAEAVSLLEDLVGDPTSQVPAQTRAWLGELYEKVGRWKDAAVTWGDLAAGNPRNGTYRLRQATALVNAGDVEGGRARLVELTRQAPRDISLWYLLSQVERRLGDAAGAEDAARHIADLDPNDLRGPLALAESYAARGDYAQVVATLRPRVASATDEDVTNGMYGRVVADLAAALQQTGDRAGAVSVLETARRRVPDDADVQFELGAAYDRAGQLDQAEAIFRGVIGKDPANASALNYLGYMLADHGRKLPEALNLIQRALAIDAANPSYLDSLGWAYFRLDKLDAARDPLERAAAALPRVSVIQDHLGELYFQLKQYRDAAAAFDKALAGDREDIDVAAVTKKRDRARELAGRF
ncbi:MAG TPA: tetratricopeptide repeat protein [Vicinamibacterales bacterium]|nr:tetratricopeptide repeat protein [Vicinamibacterales bacterium]